MLAIATKQASCLLTLFSNFKLGGGATQVLCLNLNSLNPIHNRPKMKLLR